MEELDINRREIARYLGYKSIDDLDETTGGIIEECIKEVLQVMEPKSCYESFPLIWHEDKNSCEFAGLVIISKDLIKNLKDSKEAVMLAVTIGPGFDRLVRRAEVRDMSKAAVLQSVGAEVVEAYCNKVNDEITKQVRERGLYTRPRFSPGYGDLPLAMQRDFERVLNMRKNIGISLSEGNIMTPSKSITAVIGITATPCKIGGTNCDTCNMSNDCTYRK